MKTHNPGSTESKGMILQSGHILVGHLLKVRFTTLTLKSYKLLLNYILMPNCFKTIIKTKTNNIKKL